MALVTIVVLYQNISFKSCLLYDNVGMKVLLDMSRLDMSITS